MFGTLMAAEKEARLRMQSRVSAPSSGAAKKPAKGTSQKIKISVVQDVGSLHLAMLPSS